MSLLANAAWCGEPWQWAVAAWVFAVGACVGSFLNVVIYRLPAGMSIVHPPSRCPACHRPIRFYDNVPIVSWLILRGRCRDCGAAFSPRYAWIEFASGATLLALAMTGPLVRYPSLGDMLGDMRGDAGALLAWSQVAYLAVLLACVWTAAVIALDGHRPPGRLFVAPAAIGASAALFWPQLYAMPALATLGMTDQSVGSATAWVGVYGFAAGTTAFEAAVRIAGGLPRRKVGATTRRDERAVLLGATSGLFLGWQLTLVAAAVACWLWLIHASLAVARGKPSVEGRRWWPACFALAVTAVPLAFRAWVVGTGATRPQPWPQGSPWWPLGASVAIVVPAWLSRLTRRHAAARR